MSKNKRKKKKPGGHPGGAPIADPNAIFNEIDEQVAQIEAAEESAAGPIWGQMHKLLLKAKVPPSDIASVIMSRDLEAMRTMARVLRDGPDAAPVESAPEAEESKDHGIPPETQKKAMRAFRKRLKLTRLDHESKLGVGPLTGGKKAEIDGILPPRDFPKEVWSALVIEGRLKYMGQGFYEMVGE